MEMMQESLTSKYNKLLSFGHEEVIIKNIEGLLHSFCTLGLQLHYCSKRPRFVGCGLAVL